MHCLVKYTFLVIVVIGVMFNDALVFIPLVVFFSVSVSSCS
jgi:Na+/serine symporter